MTNQDRIAKHQASIAFWHSLGRLQGKTKKKAEALILKHMEEIERLTFENASNEEIELAK